MAEPTAPEGKVHRVTLKKIGAAAFEAEGASGGPLVLDGTEAIGGEGRGMRPMDLLLTALAGCAAMDVVHILHRQKEPLEGLEIEVEGTRADAVPAPYVRAHLVFVARGPVNDKKLQRAVTLSVEKYCSVRNSLDPSIEVTHEARIEG